MVDINFIFCLAVCSTLLFNIPAVDSLRCFVCNDVRNVTECQKVVPSTNPDERCFTRVTGQGDSARFALGFRTAQQCLSLVHVTTVPPKLSIVDRDITDCDQCCAADFCNEKLCSHSSQVSTGTDGQCQDDADYNCQLISSVFSVCNDVQHSKTFCRKWCGLCDLVDGAWTTWSSWSSCDVTCGTGRRSRVRSCSNPRPSRGGSDCVGDSTELSDCTLGRCPVHGTWSVWGSCSVTCSVGLQRRDRSCSNPYPGTNGNHCFGDARDDRVCFLRACADGNWSDWGVWSDCSSSCNGGMKTRQRTCDNPTPSTFGKACVGNNQNTYVCNSRNCPGPFAAFTVTSPNHTLVSGRPIFTNAVENIGDSYSTTTAQFVCTVPGVYLFSMSILKYSPNVDVRCYFYRNGILLSSVSYTNSVSQNESTKASISIVLLKGDIFQVERCTNWQYVDPGIHTIFTGALIDIGEKDRSMMYT